MTAVEAFWIVGCILSFILGWSIGRDMREKFENSQKFTEEERVVDERDMTAAEVEYQLTPMDLTGPIGRIMTLLDIWHYPAAGGRFAVSDMDLASGRLKRDDIEGLILDRALDMGLDIQLDIEFDQDFRRYIFTWYPTQQEDDHV